MVIAGPIVRKVTASTCHIWVVTSVATCPSLVLTLEEEAVNGTVQADTVKVGTRAFIHLITFNAQSPFTERQRINYQLVFDDETHQSLWINEQKTLLYPGQTRLSFHYTAYPRTIF